MTRSPEPSLQTSTLVVLDGAMLLLFAVFVYSTVRLQRFAEVHHFWYGFVLYLATMLGQHKVRRPLLITAIVLAFVMAGDDAVQHFVQLLVPGFLSPLHQLYAITLYPVLGI